VLRLVRGGTSLDIDMMYFSVECYRYLRPGSCKHGRRKEALDTCIEAGGCDSAIPFSRPHL
jgi:hypothetical protein